MFHDRIVENEMNHIVNRDENSTFKELLIKDGSVTIHHRNIQLLEILFKHEGCLLPIMNELFEVRDLAQSYVPKQIINYQKMNSGSYEEYLL